MKQIDLNADIGEGAEFDRELIARMSSVNIACGAHAGDATCMARALNWAREAGIKVGAHPGFPDREGRGRREMNLSECEITETVESQLGALSRIGPFDYVKPHGALYNMAARYDRVARPIVEVLKHFDRELALLGLAGGRLLELGRAAGLQVFGEAFADRGYNDQGDLVKRGTPGAMIENEAAASAQVLSIVNQGEVTALSGRRVVVNAASICLHGDNEKAVAFAQRLRVDLEKNGVEIRSFLP